MFSKIFLWFSMFFLLFFQGFSMFFLWVFHDLSMGFSMFFYGFSMIFPWVFPGVDVKKCRDVPTLGRQLPEFTSFAGKNVFPDNGNMMNIYPGVSDIDIYHI